MICAREMADLLCKNSTPAFTLVHVCTCTRSSLSVGSYSSRCRNMYTGAHLNVGTVQHVWAYSYKYTVFLYTNPYMCFTHKHNNIYNVVVHLLLSIGTEAVGVGASLHHQLQQAAVNCLHETLKMSWQCIS